MEEKISSHEVQITCALNVPKLFQRDDIIKNLVSQGFEVFAEPDFIKKLKTESLPFPIVSPELAKKNNTIVFYDEPSNVLGVKGTDLKRVTLIFQELETILTEKYDIALEESVNFIEGVTILHVKTDKNAKETIKDYFHNDNKFDEIFNEKTYRPTIRIIPENRKISDRIWFDIMIEPLLSNPKNYWVRYAFRNSDINKFKENLNNIDDYIYKVINIIEGGT